MELSRAKHSGRDIAFREARFLHELLIFLEIFRKALIEGTFESLDRVSLEEMVLKVLLDNLVLILLFLHRILND